MVTLKLRSAVGGDRSGVASTVPLDAATVGTPCPFAVLSPISSSTIPLIRLGVGELPTRVKKKAGISIKKRPSKSRKSTYLDVPTSPPAGGALALRF
jgi:hypothetical protein